jgi:hypothetical protein
MAVSATKHVGAVGLVHPAFIEVSDAEKAACPICVIESKDEDVKVFDEFVKQLKEKPFGDLVARKRFETMFHGFCAGRANYGDKENAKQANEVLLLFRRIINERPTLFLPTSSSAF